MPASPLVTAGGVTTTTTGDVIVIMYLCAYHGKNKTNNSSPYDDHCKNIVDDRSNKVGGGQHVTTLDEHKIPMSILGVFPYIPLRPYTNKE